MREIYLAGGCFWGMEAYYEAIPGVQIVTVGYANGQSEVTSYALVAQTGHAETIHVIYDEQVISLHHLLSYFFRVIDPTSLNKQGNDRGTQYRTGVYYIDEADCDVIVSFIEKEQAKYNKPIVVEVEPLCHYVLAEEYHQDYLEKNPNGYCHIDQRLAKDPIIDEQLYKQAEKSTLLDNLSAEAYAITMENATEKPLENQYWNHFGVGIYVDITTGEPLFNGRDKFESQCGWPSFTKPIAPEVLRYFEDMSHGMQRIEVRSRVGNVHLGHVFPDGPRETGGLRYCINSAALRFVPREQLSDEGYGYLETYVKD